MGLYRHELKSQYHDIRRGHGVVHDGQARDKLGAHGAHDGAAHNDEVAPLGSLPPL